MIDTYVAIRTKDGRRQVLKVIATWNTVAGPKFRGVWGDSVIEFAPYQIIPATMCSMCRMPVCDGEPWHDHETE